MKPGNAIEVNGLSKRYYVGNASEARKLTGRRSLIYRLTSPWRRFQAVSQGRSAFGADEELWALRDVSFEVKEGEIVGIIGANGSGKSTLLKILSRITQPTKGGAQIRGAVGSLLEVGTGFHQELTGRENIYMNGAVLGVNSAEITRVFDDIVAFSGVGDFLDTPVKRYSSGMRVRLAFSVAVHLQPEIVLIDEVLSVGDAGFRKSSLDKIGKLARDGRTVLIVSHNLQSVQQLCSRALYLNKGELRMDGDAEQVIERYLSDHLVGDTSQGSASLVEMERESLVTSADVRFTRCALVDEQDEEIVAFRYGQALRFKVQGASYANVDELSINVKLYERHGTLIATADSKESDVYWSFRRDENFEVIVEMGDMRLVPGIYSIGLSIRQTVGVPFDFIRSALSFEVLETRYENRVPLPKSGFIVPTVQWDSNPLPSPVSREEIAT